MKFTAGYWEMRPEVTPRYPVNVHEVTRDGDALLIHATTQPHAHRGDTLNQFPISMRLSSPAAQRHPRPDLPPQGPPRT